MWKRILPWVVSFGLLAYLALTHDLEAAWEAFQRVSLPHLVLIAVLGTVVGFLYDTFCLTLLLRRFNAPVTYREMIPLKGASYLLNIINYNAAMGGMALYLKRVRKVPFLESASSLLFMNVIDVLILVAIIGGGILLSGDMLATALSAETRQYLVYVVGGFGAILVGCWIYWNAGFNFFVLGRLRKWSIFHAFRTAKIVDYAWLMALRMVMIFLYVGITWVFAHLFGVDIPFTTLMVLQPIIIFVGTIPISIAGLGTTQVVMMSFYAPFATNTTDPASLILAMSTASISIVVFVRVIIGYVFLNGVSKRVEEGSTE